ncbi:MAG: molybdopterin-dependent oxidoreductase [Chloroflexota bacterium]
MTSDAPVAGEERYRRQIAWDDAKWVTHCVNCSPGNCPFRAYIKDGRVLREEQSGTLPPIEPGVPDMNPMGCQKGAAWSRTLDAPTRIPYPMRRKGARGGGEWERMSWDDALTQIADTMIDTIQQSGPEAIVQAGTAGEGGLTAGFLFEKLINRIGGTSTDTNGDIGDFSVGTYLTFGQAAAASSFDDWFHSDLLLIWHRNPVYTAIPHYHYIAEARYRGAEVVTIAPDYSPSAMHADYYAGVRPGTDAALALSMARVVIDEGLMDEAFVRSQTDLPLLVRSDTGRFLRGADVEEGGRADQFYVWPRTGGAIAPASREALEANAEAALEGAFTTTIAGGERVEVRPVFDLLRDRLAGYSPEEASAICGVHADTIRLLARKVASKRTAVLLGFNSAKYYHGDLMERAMCLLLALTGNWGKKGTGIGVAVTGMFDGAFLFPMKPVAGREVFRAILNMRSAVIDGMKKNDPGLTDAAAAIQLQQGGAGNGHGAVPAFLWYHHTAQAERWAHREWSDPSMGKALGEYVGEAIEKGWWRGLTRPGPEHPPRVLFEIGTNWARRMRGGRGAYAPLLDGLELLVCMDWRVSASALQADILLPAAAPYEKPGFAQPSPQTLNLTFSDACVAPAGEARPEWEVFADLARKIEERAKARGFVEYTDSRGAAHRLDDLGSYFTANGAFETTERVLEEMVLDTVESGTLPPGTSIDTFREQGHVRFTDWGITPFAAVQAADLRADETHAALRHHVERGLPYPTLTRRAQFYIDHPWFIDAGEALPVHKENPPMGGDYPLVMTSGHSRWSIHSMNQSDRAMLGTHRGEPVVLLSVADAAARGIDDGALVRVHNDVASFVVHAKVSGGVRPGQAISYNGWEPYQYADWKHAAEVEPGMVKWLHFAGGEGHLRYWTTQWQPAPIDRAFRVEVERTTA